MTRSSNQPGRFSTLVSTIKEGCLVLALTVVVSWFLLDNWLERRRQTRRAIHDSPGHED